MVGIYLRQNPWIVARGNPSYIWMASLVTFLLATGPGHPADPGSVDRGWSVPDRSETRVQVPVRLVTETLPAPRGWCHLR